MAPVGAVCIDATGFCRSVHVTVRTTSVVHNGVVFNVVSQNSRFVFLEPEGASVPLAPFLPLDISAHLPFAPTIVMRAVGAEAAPKKRRTLDVSSLTLGAWQAAVMSAHTSQPRVVLRPLPAVLAPAPPSSGADKKVRAAATKGPPASGGRRARTKHAQAEHSDEEEEDDEAELELGENSDEYDKDEVETQLDDVDYDDDAEEDALEEGDEEVDDVDNEEDGEDDEQGDVDAKDDYNSGSDNDESSAGPQPKRLRNKLASVHI
jgi:hypothetical protein